MKIGKRGLKGSICIPVMMHTFPVSLGPLESPAIFLSFGMPSKVPWSGTGETSCSLKAARRYFAVVAEVLTSGILGIYETMGWEVCEVVHMRKGKR